MSTADEAPVALGSLEQAISGGKAVPEPTKTPKVGDEARAGPLSRLTFAWMLPLIRLGYERTLREDDITDNLARDNVGRHYAAFARRLYDGVKVDGLASVIPASEIPTFSQQ